jgi:hypothetical protein
MDNGQGTETPLQPQSPQQRGGPRLSVVVIVTILTTLVTLWLVFAIFFPRTFTPVHLSAKEERVLETKLRGLNLPIQISRKQENRKGKPVKALEPQPYSESEAAHDITLTEREVNALIATNTDLADKLAIDLSPDLISARLLVPLDPDLPVVGGKILKLSSGFGLAYQNGRPSVILKGVTLWGVALPNSWLGNLKNVDLVHEYGDEGFWKAFAEGVEDMKVGDGTLIIKLKE